ncbi:hypothetical protein D9613_009727 [Agrocybe pediades]|uniref:protein-L-isoaspartate(D-aspartate) O-methyltransferase n=1 Tax=Agrocybe pediades TaxID=84607 RepID=A0A8H4QW04_9AGAR|nr:hypothetical protein D9613_009727 [Agrocybe pediades]
MNSLIANMKANGIIHSERVVKAMTAVDRANYVPYTEDAYEDSPQLQQTTRIIGHGATISAPHMCLTITYQHAYASEHLLTYLRPGAKVLDVGSGSGYLVAVLHELVSPGGKVVGIEHIPELVEDSINNLKKDGREDAMKKGEIVMISGDGRLGYPEGGPYDAIHVGAAAPKVPQALIDQLAPKGRMFIPVGTYMQNIEHIDKDEDGNIRREEVMGVRAAMAPPRFHYDSSPERTAISFLSSDVTGTDQNIPLTISQNTSDFSKRKQNGLAVGTIKIDVKTRIKARSRRRLQQQKLTQHTLLTTLALTGIAFATPVVPETICKGNQVVTSTQYIGANKDVKLEIITCDSIVETGASLQSRQSPNVCGAACTTNCFLPAGGGPDPNDCHVIADALRFDSQNVAPIFTIGTGASVIDFVAPNCQATQNAHGGNCVANDGRWFIQ